MKFFHLSDLHLGKRLLEYSLLEDQACILKQICTLVESERPDAVLIAGDVYDKSVPSAEAVALLDEFLFSLSRLGVQVFVISGNHDSAERLSFGNRLMEHSGVHICSAYDGKITPYTMQDAHGAVQIYMLPFIRPSSVRRFSEDEGAGIQTYTQAVAAAIAAMQVDPGVRNVLIAHQFVTGARPGGSEEAVVGGLDNVEAAVFAPFDYVALGHIHSAQWVESRRIRYCGTPLKYSLAEAEQEKTITVVELEEKGNPVIWELPLKPLRDMVKISGTYQELTAKSFYQNTTLQQDYVHITLTDEEDIPQAHAKLQVIYPYMLQMKYDNTRTRTEGNLQMDPLAKSKSPMELFCGLYRQVNGQDMTGPQQDYLEGLIQKIWGDGA